MAYAEGSGGSKCCYVLGGFVDQYVIGSRSRRAPELDPENETGG
jgi:hypothetical protein